MQFSSSGRPAPGTSTALTATTTAPRPVRPGRRDPRRRALPARQRRPRRLPPRDASPTTTPTGTSTRCSPRPRRTARRRSDQPTGPSTPRPRSPTTCTHSRITLSPVQRADLRSGGIDARVLQTLAWIGQHHTVVMTALKSDHSTLTVDGWYLTTPPGVPSTSAPLTARSARARASVAARSSCASSPPSPARCVPPSSIYCWDPDGPTDPRGFARADHCDHIHVGWDA